MGNGSDIEVVKTFLVIWRHLEGAEGTAELAVTNRIRSSWSTFRQLAPVLKAKDTHVLNYANESVRL